MYAGSILNSYSDDITEILLVYINRNRFRNEYYSAYPLPLEDDYSICCRVFFCKMLSCSKHVSSKRFSLRRAHYRVRNQTLTDWRNENVIRFECNGESRQCSAALR